MNTTRKTAAALLLAAALLPAAAPPADAGDPSRQAEGRRLIQLIGMETLLTQMADGALTQQIEATRLSDPNIPDPVLEIIRDELEAAYRDSFDEMLNWAAGLFTDRLNPTEMKETIAFYSSATGQKVLHVTPQIMQESMAIGQRWSEQIMIRVGPKIEARLGPSGRAQPGYAPATREAPSAPPRAFPSASASSTTPPRPKAAAQTPVQQPAPVQPPPAMPPVPSGSLPEPQ
ncbi:MAG: DUF2059 domain-containing protein [Alphaproteobacteria bacterium]|nr:DUF2059 domain-containing protein [Alphaproteobacteria bacterium]